MFLYLGYFSVKISGWGFLPVEFVDQFRLKK